jgi:hypothetical protein
LLEQASSSNPDLVRRRNRLAGLVEDGFGALRSFKTGKSEPELDGKRYHFHGAGEEYAGVRS